MVKRLIRNDAFTLIADSFIFCFFPLYSAYISLQLEWHDHGGFFNFIVNLFEKGYFYFYDIGRDFFYFHFSPFLYVIAVLVRLSSNSYLVYLTVHVLALSFGSYALFLIVRNVTGSKSIAANLLWSFLYPNKENLFISLCGLGSSEADAVVYLISDLISTLKRVFTGHGFDFFSTLWFLPFFAPLKAFLVMPSTCVLLNCASPSRASLAYYSLSPRLFFFLQLFLMP
ncbi:membrane protein [Candidatus Magnetoovum chiemensis]|nr:membrane protein [Candidatus Magnetoovum chiemensis]